MTGDVSSSARRLEAPLIRTNRLLLRPYRIEDFEHLLTIYGGDRAQFIGGRLRPRQVWDGFMNVIGHWPVHGFGGWAVELSGTGDLVGEVAVHHPVDYPEVELGWLLFEGFEGKGYATEAAAAARDFAFREAGVSSLVSYIDPDNHPSRRLAERMGAVLDPTAPTPNGDPCLVYRHPKS
ncbi:GNAT family N-acetyltransferase [Rhizobium sp. G21]|uniref:GNAT family N-acetyltransferase n=1 Tax=Rhizobium sp. G21 TaxID=2758439 RepID=UPI00160323F5|nr:GNAT family N-acetyltransferase [Rhizobium sp. G21]MBB1247679.1 GNAT family N-acetyltransferase [Rhizobium sp. G21]